MVNKFKQRFCIKLRMLIQINTNIVATAEHLILVQIYRFLVQVYRLKHDKKYNYFWNWYELICAYWQKKNKDILILGEWPTQRQDDTTLRAEAKYPINFTQSIKISVFSLHYTESHSLLFVNTTQIYRF